MSSITTTETIAFELDGQSVEAQPGETIWQVANRQGTQIPHLCYLPKPGYRADGNCRACMVEIVGERVLAASCIRKPTAGMKVVTNSQRASSARSLVFELLLADQPERSQTHDPNSKLWNWADRLNLSESRFTPRHVQPTPDRSHSAMAVHLDACIHCNLCVRACREVQVNDVIGMSQRGHKAKITFDFDDPMGQSTCVACGECVQACPTGALLPSTVVDSAGKSSTQADRTVDSLCPYCGVGCQLTYHISNDRLLHVEGRDGPANHNRLCVKGRFGFDYVHHPHRLLQPLIRRTDAPKSANCQVDPANPWSHFRPASWEEALDFAASGLKRIRDQHGPKALAGFGSAKGSNEEAYLFQKLVRVGFGCNNVDHCTRLCHASSVAALLEGIGSGAVTAPFYECANTDVIVVIGANPTVNHPVAATFIKNAAKRGAKLIVMDPRGQTLSRHATHMVQFRPGTDVALLSAILHVIIDEQLYDPEFIEKYTEGFENLKKGVKDLTPEAMESVCKIPADQIREIARIMGQSPAMLVFWGMGVSQHIHGTDNARCLIALGLITGNVGKPGAGLHPLRGQNNVQGASDVGLIPMVFPDYQPVRDLKARTLFEELWDAKLDPEPGLTVVEIIKAIHRDEIRGMYIMGENPAMSDPDVQHARAALAKLEHLVVQEIFLTETAFHADVVLPASAFPEKTGSFTNTNRQVQLARQAIPLPGDVRQDLWIIQQIARRLGLDWDITGPDDVFEEFRKGMPSIKGISWKRLEQEDSVTYPCDSEDESGHELIFGNGFPTLNGRGKLMPVSLIPPDEEPDNDYPWILTTGRLLEHWHTGSMTRRSTVLDNVEPEAVAQISPRDLAKLGIKPGDLVRVRTRRGTIQLKARSDRDVPPGIVFIPFCFAEAPANFLTNDALDPFGKIPEFKFCAAVVEPAST